MKILHTVVLCGVLFLSLSGCQAQVQSDVTLPMDTEVQQVQQEVFSDLRKVEGEILSVRFTATPNAEQTPFFYIDAAEDTEVTLRYCFTKTEGNAQIGCYTSKDDQTWTVPLDMAETTQEVDNELTLQLKKGMNIFYITGEGCTCSLRCEIDGLDAESVLYANTVPEIME